MSLRFVLLAILIPPLIWGVAAQSNSSQQVQVPAGTSQGLLVFKGKDWAIPAATYLGRLETSSDPIPTTPKAPSSLNASKVENPGEAVEVTQPGAGTVSGHDRRKQMLRLVATSTLGEVISGLSEKDQKAYAGLQVLTTNGAKSLWPIRSASGQQRSAAHRGKLL